MRTPVRPRSYPLPPATTASGRTSRKRGAPPLMALSLAQVVPVPLVERFATRTAPGPMRHGLGCVLGEQFQVLVQPVYPDSVVPLAPAPLRAQATRLLSVHPLNPTATPACLRSIRSALLSPCVHDSPSTSPPLHPAAPTAAPATPPTPPAAS